MKELTILATGRSIPARVVDNEAMSRMVETNDEWIVTRTGVHERRYAETETNPSLATAAARLALERSGVDPADVAFLVVATFTGECRVPSVACHVQRALGLPETVLAFDLNAACSGFLFGLRTMYGLLLTAPGKYGILIGSETLTRVTNFDDRSTCILFGDGAGAVVTGLGGDGGFHSVFGTRGDPELIGCRSLTDDPYDHPRIHMDGRGTFRFAVEIIGKCVNDVLTSAGLTLADVDYVVCHQANERIIRSVQKHLGAPDEQFFVDIGQFGNTSAASIPIALDDLNERGLLSGGKRVVCVGFGGGLTWGAALVTFA